MGRVKTDNGCYHLEDILHSKPGGFGIPTSCSVQEPRIVKLGESSSGQSPHRSPMETGMAGVDKSGSGEVEVTSTGDEFISGFGRVLTQWIDATLEANRTQRATPFHSVRAAPMHIRDYLERIRKYFACSDECFVIALVFIERAGKIDPAMTVCALNAHRLLLIAVMLAAKIQDDVYYSNAYYAKVGGLAVKEVNRLEVTFLKMLDFKAYVDPQEYQLYHGLVCKATSAEELHKEPEPEPCSRTTM